MATSKRDARIRRHRRVRKRVSGSPGQPRLAVFRSLNHIYAQVIDDTHKVTLAACSSLEADVRSASGDFSKADTAKIVGAKVAERALSQGINRVVFDRGGYRYHGRVKALAEAVRNAGIKL